MGKISKKILKEIKLNAEEYITAVKGKDLTKKDLTAAVNLMKLGYIKAKLKVKKREKQRGKKTRINIYKLKRAY
jgi:hypothetical protein